MGTQNINLSLPPYNSSNWNSPLNDNFTALDTRFGGTANIALAGSNVTLTAADVGNMRINLSGAIGGSTVTVIFPDTIGGQWVISNNTTSSAGGTIYVRTAGYTIQPVTLPKSGSVIVFSDGKNIYSAVSGEAGQYLPLSGGTIDGDLNVNKDLKVTAKGTFGSMEVTGSAKFKDVEITGSINLSLTTIGVAKFTVGGAQISGNQVFGVSGESEFNGNTKIESGDLEITLGSFQVKNGASVNLLSGATTLPSGAALNIKNGATVTFESGSILSTQGTFSPAAVTTGDIRSTTGITVTGTAGVKTGSGGLTSEGPSTFNDDAIFKDVVTFQKDVTFSAKMSASGAEFIDPVVKSSGYASQHFVSGNLEKGVLTKDTVGYFGLYNENDMTKYARLSINTGKWTASGGVGIGISGAVAQALATFCPAAVYDTEHECGGQAVDIEDVLLALVEELVSVKSELLTLKGR